EDGIRDPLVTGVQTCALPISTGTFADMIISFWENLYEYEFKPWADSWVTRPSVRPGSCPGSVVPHGTPAAARPPAAGLEKTGPRSEEHTSELQSRVDLVCRLL